MERLVAEVEAERVLRNLERKRQAEAILAGPSKLRPVLTAASVIGASLFAQFAFADFSAPVITRALLVGMLAGLVIASFELWAVRRRLEAVIQLLNLCSHEQA